jgi:hypothetical protein
MTWHNFEDGEFYRRDDIVAACQDRINGGDVKNTATAEWCLDHIRRAKSNMLRFTPFGTKSFGKCPWNPSVWETRAGKAIWTPEPVPYRLGK